jgi:hypothetical protein
MKTIKFVREQNTVNEYTSNCFDDCSGDFYKTDDVRGLIEQKKADINAQGHVTSTYDYVTRLAKIQLLDDLLQNL